MRMKKIVENRTLKAAAAEFFAFKRAQKIRERTLHDYQRYINPFVEQSSNSMDIDVLKREILEYFANIPTTSPARYNHPYQYLHALFSWCAKQDYGHIPVHRKLLSAQPHRAHRVDIPHHREGSAKAAAYCLRLPGLRGDQHPQLSQVVCNRNL